MSRAKTYESPAMFCCGYVPLKYGVIFYGITIWVLSILAVLSAFTEDIRGIVGGYTYTTRLLTGVLGLLGIFFSLVSFAGLYDNSTGWVRSFARYAFLRAVGVAAIFCLDWGMLKMCEDYGPAGKAFTSTSGFYNVAIATVALAGKCDDVRQMYPIVAILNILVALAGAYHASRWCHVTDYGPAKHIAFYQGSRTSAGYTDLGYPAAHPGYVHEEPPTPLPWGVQPGLEQQPWQSAGSYAPQSGYASAGVRGF